MRNGVIASLLIGAILAGAGVGYLVGNVNERTTTLYSSTSLTQTLIVYPHTFTSTTCASTSMPAELSCPHFWNQTYTILVNYTGDWIASYQGYLGTENESNLAEAGTFYGHAIGSQTFTITGWTQGQAITVCAEAQKLDSSSSTLILRILPPTNVMNETSSAYGTARTCIQVVIE